MLLGYSGLLDFRLARNFPIQTSHASTLAGGTTLPALRHTTQVESIDSDILPTVHALYSPWTRHMPNTIIHDAQNAHKATPRRGCGLPMNAVEQRTHKRRYRIAKNCRDYYPRPKARCIYIDKAGRACIPDVNMTREHAALQTPLTGDMTCSDGDNVSCPQRSCETLIHVGAFAYCRTTWARPRGRGGEG